MKKILTPSLLFAVAITAAQSKGLYYVPNDTEESIPLKWSVGADVIWDSNTTPGGAFDGDETLSVNPYVGLSFVSVTPQTTWDVYLRLGVIYYLDEPNAPGSDDTYGQARAGINMTHRFNERLRLTSRTYAAYELEPDYSYGPATTRQIGEYFYWSTDNSLGYRWTERFATYTGIIFDGIQYQNGVPNSDRSTWTAYNQFRYQLSPQSVLTASYRYAQTTGDGLATDSTNQYLLVGIEHRFSPNTIAIVNAGAQFRDVEGTNGYSGTSPFLEANIRTQVNSQLSISSFVRYGIEDFDTVFAGIQYEDKAVLRVGVAGSYQISPSFSLYSGVDLILSSYDQGRTVPGGLTAGGSPDETLVNAYIGGSVKLTEILTASLTYNYTDSSADAPIFGRDYDRSRISLGLSAEF